jgi:hypothetical protein
MRGARAWWVLVGIVLVAVGCAGKDFTRPAPESLVLGRTTYGEINGRFGSPYREGTLVKNDRTVRTAAYVYSTVGGEPVAAGVTPARGIDFFFLDEVLVGHQFASSFKADHTDFDDEKAPGIRKGESTRGDVVSLLGSPSGVQIYPLVAGKDDTGLVWTYVQVRTTGLSFKIYQKQLNVTVNPTGVVTDVTLTVSGER